MGITFVHPVSGIMRKILITRGKKIIPSIKEAMRGFRQGMDDRAFVNLVSVSHF